MGATPFHPSILKVRLPKNFDKPTNMRYYGTKDPQEHLTAFEARMNLEGVGDAVRCRAFPVTLAGPAIRWFNALPQGSITAFADISQSFLARVAKEYINDEEVSQVVAANKRQLPNPPARQAPQVDRYKEAPKDGTLGKQSKQPLRVGRFTNYTPLTAPIVEVYQQIADKRIISRPRPLKERTGGNKSLYCDYHKGFGYKTQDCFDIKDALEQAIRDGKLSEFSRFIREPRRREHERSEEDHSRTVKPRQEPIGDANNPPTFVVNVVVGRDSPPKSNSVTKKDTRVLSISTEAMVGTGLVRRILVDTGADSNILFRNVFDAMGLKESDLKNHQHGVMGLGDNYIKPDGTISFPICLGTGDAKKSVMAEFVVLGDSTAYNIILGRKTINKLSAVICTKFLTMKFITYKGIVGSIRGDLEAAVVCDNTSLSLRKESKKAAGMFLADLDARMEDKPRPEPEGDMKKFQIGKSADQFTFVNRNLPHELKDPLMEVVRETATSSREHHQTCRDWIPRSCPTD
ncbi:uncharacterized protein [Arachis hypogaea]|uniref:uncharacterized protein n=1 Tax=Arachis hypogaea TaxID=3818 RepID=UPI003B2247D3